MPLFFVLPVEGRRGSCHHSYFQTLLFCLGFLFVDTLPCLISLCHVTLLCLHTGASLFLFAAVDSNMTLAHHCTHCINDSAFVVVMAISLHTLFLWALQSFSLLFPAFPKAGRAALGGEGGSGSAQGGVSRDGAPAKARRCSRSSVMSLIPRATLALVFPNLRAVQCVSVVQVYPRKPHSDFAPQPC